MHAFEQQGRPLSPEEVHQLARRTLKTINLATVYRTINRLVETDWLEPVTLPGFTPRYERTGKHHHHHFVCTQCERTYDVEGCGLNVRALVPSGFQLREHHLTLFGTCRSCRV